MKNLMKNLMSSPEPTVLESLSQSVQQYTGIDIQGGIFVCILVAVLAVTLVWLDWDLVWWEQTTSGGSVDHSWTCLKCTLINKRDAKECEVCEASKPVQDNTTNQLQYDKSEEGQHEKKNENSSNQTQLEERMTRALECPVCWVVMKANIFQCANGHTICRTCYLRREMKNCPVCRENFNKRAPVRCLFAEQMAQNLENNS